MPGGKLENIESIGSNWLKAVENVYNVGLEDYDLSLSVKTIKFDENYVYAEVKEKSGEIYKVELELKMLETIEKEQVLDTLSSNPLLSIEVIQGVFCSELTSLIKDDEIPLLPSSKDDFSYITCCDDNKACKHVLAVLKSVAEKINKNPFLVFDLKGFNAEDFDSVSGGNDEFKTRSIESFSDEFIEYEKFKGVKEDSFFNESYTFNKIDIEKLFSLLPSSPSSVPRGDYKSKLINIYTTVDEEIETILTEENLPALRDTEFYFFVENNEIKAFVTPSNNFLFYLKSKGSLMRYKTENIEVPVNNNGEVSLVLKEGIVLPADCIFEYFIKFSLLNREVDISYSSMWLKHSAALAIEIVKSLAFLPDVKVKGDEFTICYKPLLSDEKVKEAVSLCYKSSPANVFYKKDGSVFINQAGEEFLSALITFIVKKIAFIKSNKLKGSNFFTAFTKNEYFKMQSKDKRIAQSILNWLENLSVHNKNTVPLFKVEANNNDEFFLSIDIVSKNDAQNVIISLEKLFSTDEMDDAESVRLDISRQLIMASEHLPVLTQVLASKGSYQPQLSLNEMLELLSKTTSKLRDLGINIVIPKSFKSIISPKVSVKASLKNKSIDFKNIISQGANSFISMNEILDFSYEVALGDMILSKDEFLKLVEGAGDIIKYKDKYVLLKPDEVNAIIKKLEAPPPEITSGMGLFHSVMSESFDDMHFSYDEAIKKAIDDFIKPEEIDLPVNLTGEYRPYQERGYKWLYSNSVKGFGSCIADDMGLGKTIQVLGMLLKMKEDGKLNHPTLVICPTTLVGNWQKECVKFAPSLDLAIYHGSERSEDFEGYDLIITTYGLLRQDIDKFKDKSWSYVVIDEAQNIKNPDTAQSQAVKSLKAGACIAMTGTPVENRLTELWSIFDFINKGYLGSVRGFQQNYAIPIERFKISDKVERLKLATSPFVLRRLKTDKSIIDDLPDKIVIDEYCYLTKEQAALYEKVLADSMKVITSAQGIDRRGNIFKLITALKQICNHPMQYTKVGNASKSASGKAEKALDLIENILDNGEKAIIFTQYREMGEILSKLIKTNLNEEAPFFHGGLSRVKRDAMIDTFQTDSSVKLMIISLKAGGTGLNLTAASNVIHYDLWWNPAVEDQATDRVFRIGQTENVNVHRLVTLGTFEEKIDEMIKSKKELANLTVSTGENWITELTNKELKEIFSLSKVEL